MRKSHAENGADCQRNLLIDSIIFRKVCVVKILGVVPVADTDVEVAVDAVEVDEVEVFERLALHPAARARPADGRSPSTRGRSAFRVPRSSRVSLSPFSP